MAADVGSHDDYRVFEIDGAPMAVGKAPVIENLQQDIEHILVRFLDLIEQTPRNRAAAAPLR